MVEARIYSTAGRAVKTLRSGQLSSVGENLLRWDGRDSGGDFVADGLYIVVIEADGAKAQQTFVVLNK